MSHLDSIIKNLETICGCTSAARDAATAMRELARQHKPLTEAQQIHIAETLVHLDFTGDFVASVAAVIRLTEAAHGINPQPPAP